MKTLNLTMAIIYTIIYALMFLFIGVQENDRDIMVGCVLLSGPIIANWITYYKLNKK